MTAALDNMYVESEGTNTRMCNLTGLPIARARKVQKMSGFFNPVLILTDRLTFSFFIIAKGMRRVGGKRWLQFGRFNMGLSLYYTGGAGERGIAPLAFSKRGSGGVAFS